METDSKQKRKNLHQDTRTRTRRTIGKITIRKVIASINKIIVKSLKQMKQSNVSNARKKDITRETVHKSEARTTLRKPQYVE